MNRGELDPVKLVLGLLLVAAVVIATRKVKEWQRVERFERPRDS